MSDHLKIKIVSKFLTVYWKPLILIAALALSSCKKDKADDNLGIIPENIQAPAFYNLALETDKACYNPGEEVSFTLNGQINQPARVRYKTLTTFMNSLTQEL